MFNQMIQGGFSGIGYGYGNSYGNGRPPGPPPHGPRGQNGRPPGPPLTVALVRVVRVREVASALRFSREYRTERSRKLKPSP